MSETNARLEIDIARDFSRFPGGRYARHGKYSGEEFRNRKLAPALREAIERATRLVVRIDGVRGYGSSFLEEAFGGLVRVERIPASQVLSHLLIRADDRRFRIYQDLINRYINEASTTEAG